LGDTGYRRGLMTVLKSVPFLVKKIPNLKVVIVGSSSDFEVLKSYVKSHKIDQYVKLHGFQPEKDFPRYIRNAEIGLCPIHKNIHHETTYANKIFQYLSYGKPILVSNCLSQQKLVQKYNCGLVFEDQNQESFSKMVIELFENKALYETMSLNAKKSTEETFSWNLSGKKVIQTLRRIRQNQLKKPVTIKF
jgi:glycosyltransferase involved in cell wall biosynthesis